MANKIIDGFEVIEPEDDVKMVDGFEVIEPKISKSGDKVSKEGLEFSSSTPIAPTGDPTGGGSLPPPPAFTFDKKSGFDVAVPKTGAVDILKNHKDLNFVDRIFNPEQYPARDNSDGTASTHMMASAEVDGKYIVYPTLVFDKETRQLFEPEDPIKHAMDSKEFISFDNEAEAQSFAQGGYKAGFNAGKLMRAENLFEQIKILNSGQKGGFSDFGVATEGRPQFETEMQFDPLKGLKMAKQGLDEGLYETPGVALRNLRLFHPDRRDVFGTEEQQRGEKSQNRLDFDAAMEDFRKKEEELVQKSGLNPELAKQIVKAATREGLRNRIVTFSENVGNMTVEEKLPFVGAFVQAEGLVDIVDIGMRLEDDPKSVTDKELMRIHEFIQESSRDKAFWASVSDVVSELPAFGIELFTTSGIATFAKEGAKKGGHKILEKYLSEIGKEAVEKALKERSLTLGLGSKVVAGTVGEITRLIPASSGRIAKNTLERMIPEVQFTENESNELVATVNKKGDDIYEALAKAGATSLIENMSEQSGNAFSILGGAAKDKLARMAVFKGLMKANPEKAPSKLMEIMKKAGWNGVVNEMLEERVGEVGRAVVGVEDYNPPDLEQVMGELVSFAVPGGLIAVSEAARKPQNPQEVDIADLANKLDQKVPAVEPVVQEKEKPIEVENVDFSEKVKEAKDKIAKSEFNEELPADPSEGLAPFEQETEAFKFAEETVRTYQNLMEQDMKADGTLTPKGRRRARVVARSKREDITTAMSEALQKVDSISQNLRISPKRKEDLSTPLLNFVETAEAMLNDERVPWTKRLGKSRQAKVASPTPQEASKVKPQTGAIEKTQDEALESLEKTGELPEVHKGTEMEAKWLAMKEAGHTPSDFVKTLKAETSPTPESQSDKTRLVRRDKDGNVVESIEINPTEFDGTLAAMGERKKRNERIDVIDQTGFVYPVQGEELSVEQLESQREERKVQVEKAVAESIGGFKTPPTVEVIRDISETDIPIGQIPNNVLMEAMHWNGKTYIFSDRIADIDRIPKLVAHEVIVHQGLKTTLDEDTYNRVMDGVFAMNQSSKDRLAQAAGFPDFTAMTNAYSEIGGINIETKAGQREIAEELVAIVAEEMVGVPSAQRPSWVRKIITDIKIALQKLFPGIKFSEQDIMEIVRRSARTLQQKGVDPSADVAEGMQASVKGFTPIGENDENFLNEFRMRVDYGNDAVFPFEVSVRGLNASHALEKAYGKWNGADIEIIDQVKSGATEDKKLETDETLEEDVSRIDRELYVPERIPAESRESSRGTPLETISNVLANVHRASEGRTAKTLSKIDRNQRVETQEVKSSWQDIRSQEQVALEQLVLETPELLHNHQQFQARHEEQGLKGGTEHDVYYDETSGTVVKSFRSGTGNSLLEYFQRIQLHNHYFPHAAYNVVGFTRFNQKLRPLLEQRAVNLEDAKPVTDIEGLEKDVEARGFSKPFKDALYYQNEEGVLLTDIGGGNVLALSDNGYAFIDPVLRMDTRTKLDRVRKEAEKMKDETPEEASEGIEPLKGTTVQFSLKLAKSDRFKGWFGDWERSNEASKVVDGEGRPMIVYRGDFKADAVGAIFAIQEYEDGGSGGLYFTDDPAIASSYSTGKHYVIDTLDTRFPDIWKGNNKVSYKNLGTLMSPKDNAAIEQAVLTLAERNEDGLQFSTKKGEQLVSKSTWDWELRRAKGDYLLAAEEQLVNSATLEPEEFGEFLEKAGVVDKMLHVDPSAPNSVVTPVYLNIRNPLDTATITEELVNKLAAMTGENDQNIMSLRRALKDGMREPVTFLTPEFRQALLNLGYDGIQDEGGLITRGPSHKVFVALEPRQMMSAITGSFFMKTEEADRVEPRAQIETEAFKNWFGDSKVLNDDGTPQAVYHGTTHEFWTFREHNLNVESDFGKAYYFTSSFDDGQSNYAGEGPDLTNRIVQMAERVVDDIQDSIESVGVEQTLEDYGLEQDDYNEETMEMALTYARNELSGGNQRMLKAFLRMENPVVIEEDGGTILEREMEYNTEDYEEEAREEIIDEEYESEAEFLKDMKDESRKAEFEDLVRQRAEEKADENGDFQEGGSLIDLFEAIDQVSFRYTDANADEIKEAIGFEDMISAHEVMERVKRVAFITDDDGNSATGDFFKELFDEMGFDGAIFPNANERFPGMGMPPNTTHYVTWNSTSIKSATDNNGAFDPTNADIRYSLKGVSYKLDRKHSSSDAEHNAKVEIFEALQNAGQLSYGTIEEIEWRIDGMGDTPLEVIGDNRFTDEIVAEHQELIDDGAELEDFEITDFTVFDWVKQQFPVTNDPSVAGYILPNGEMLAMSYDGRQRDIDHREINYPGKPSGTDGMIEFMNYGAVRIHGDSGSVSLRTKPTSAQMRIIRDIIDMSEGGFIDMEIPSPENPLEYAERESFSDIDSGSQAASKINRFYNQNAPKFSIKAVPNSPGWQSNYPKATVMTTFDRLKKLGREKGEDLIDGKSKAFMDAKAGDENAAYEIILALMNKDQRRKLQRLAQKYPDAKIAYPMSEEEGGSNMLPLAFAKFAGMMTKLPVVGFDQMSKCCPDNAGMTEKMLNPPMFEGEVEDARKYILFDDFVETGVTMSGLRHYIESEGGSVVQSVTLSAKANKAGSSPVVVGITPSTVAKLKNKFDEKQLNEILNEYGISRSVQHLTEAGGRFLNGFKSLDAIREELAKGEEDAGREEDRNTVPSAEAATLEEGARNHHANRLDASQLDTGTDTARKEELRRLLNKNTTRLQQNVADDLKGLEVVEKFLNNGVAFDASTSAWKMALMTRNLPQVLNQIFDRGMVRYDSEAGIFTIREDGIGLKTIFDPLSSKGKLDKWERYAKARSAVERAEAKFDTRWVDLPEGIVQATFGFGKEDAQAWFIEGSQDADVVTAWNHWQTFNSHMRDLLLETGLITQEFKDTLDGYLNYVPFYRDMEEFYDDAMFNQPKRRGKKGIEGQSSGIKRFKGSKKKVRPILENIFSQISFFTDSAYKNIAMQRAIEIMTEGGLAEPLSQQGKVSDVAAGEVARKLEALGANVNITPEQRRETIQIFQPFNPDRPDQVSVTINGKKQFYKVEDNLLLEAVKSMGPENLNIAMRVLMGARSLNTRFITSTPEFAVANYLRDTVQNWVLLNQGYNPLPFIEESAKGVIKAYMNASDVQKIGAAGSGGSFYRELTPENVRGELKGAKKGWRPWRPMGRAWREYEKILNAFEQANRVAVYNRIKDTGGTEAEASFQAMDVLNFGMKGGGSLTRFFIRTVPFLNARIQGLYKIGRELTTTDTQKRNEIMLRGGTLFFGAIALWAANYWDEDEDGELWYRKLTNQDKLLYYHFRIPGTNKIVRIPKPFEIGALFTSVPEFAMDKLAGDATWADTAERFSKMIMDIFAFDPRSNPLIKIPTEQISDRSLFWNTPIVGYLSKKDPVDQVKFNTSLTAQHLGKVLEDVPTKEIGKQVPIIGPFAEAALTVGESPVRFDAAMQSLLGGFSRYLLAASDIVVSNMTGEDYVPPMRLKNELAAASVDPVYNRFFKESDTMTNKFFEEYYDLRTELDMTYSHIRELFKQGELETAEELLDDEDVQLKITARELINEVGKRLTSLREQRRLNKERDTTWERKVEAETQLLRERQNLIELTEKITAYIKEGQVNDSVLSDVVKKIRKESSTVKKARETFEAGESNLEGLEKAIQEFGL